MKKILIMMLMSAFAAAGVEDVYRFKATLDVPRVYDNTASAGYRKYQKQRLSGYARIKYEDGIASEISFTNVKNETHKISGKNIAYECEINDMTEQRWNAIGSNKTLKFNTASVAFGLIALPSYALTDADEDNSLYLYFAGKGKITGKKTPAPTLVSGYVTGTMGCSCGDYGHVSPTRIIGVNGASGEIDDVASVYGKWNMKFVRREK